MQVVAVLLLSLTCASAQFGGLPKINPGQIASVVKQVDPAKIDPSKIDPAKLPSQVEETIKETPKAAAAAADAAASAASQHAQEVSGVAEGIAHAVDAVKDAATQNVSEAVNEIRNKVQEVADKLNETKPEEAFHQAEETLHEKAGETLRKAGDAAKDAVPEEVIQRAKNSDTKAMGQAISKAGDRIIHSIGKPDNNDPRTKIAEVIEIMKQPGFWTTHWKAVLLGFVIIAGMTIGGCFFFRSPKAARTPNLLADSEMISMRDPRTGGRRGHETQEEPLFRQF